MRTWRILLFVVAAAFAVLPAAAETPDVALAKLMGDARAEAAVPGACTVANVDRLVRAFCENAFGETDGDVTLRLADLDGGKCVEKRFFRGVAMKATWCY